MSTDALEERFVGSALDRDVWVPHYLRAGSVDHVIAKRG